MSKKTKHGVNHALSSLSKMALSSISKPRTHITPKGLSDIRESQRRGSNLSQPSVKPSATPGAMSDIQKSLSRKKV